MSSALRWLAVPIMSGAALMLTGRSSHASAKLETPSSAKELRALVLPVEQRIGQHRLADFLSAVAFTESRFDPLVQNASGRRGLFQMTGSAANLDELGVGPDVLFNKRWSIALIAWYIQRLRNYGKPGQIIDYLAIRRGMAYPNLVSDVGNNEQRSREVRSRFSAALKHVGLPQSFMQVPAFPSSYNWPGIDAVIASAGVSGVS